MTEKKRVYWIAPGKIFNYMEMVTTKNGEIMCANLCYVTKIEYIDGQGNLCEIINDEFINDNFDENETPEPQHIYTNNK